MERKILFKGKKLSDGTWVKGYYYKECDNTYIIEDRQEHSMLNRNEAVLVDPSTVCQYTGLKDKNGNDIFEGDYLTNDGTAIFVVGFVVYQYAASHKGENEFIYSLYALSKGCTVCGNRFDRKEGEK